MTSRPFLVRLIAPFAVLLILIVAVCGAAIHQAGERATRSQQVQDLHRLTRLVRQWAPAAQAAPAEGKGGATAPATLSPADLSRLMDAARVLATRVTLIDGSGRVLFDSDAPAERMENHNDRPEVVEARRQGTGSSFRISRTLGEQSLYVAELLDPHDPSGPVLRLSSPRRTWVDLSDSAWTVVGGAAAATACTLVLLTLLLQRQWITPTRRLARAAEQMAAGHWGQRVEPAGAEELAFFSTRLNLVASHAERQLSDLHHKQADLQALVDTLPDPILVTDSADKLILINQPAARLLDLPKPRALQQKFVHVVNDEAVLQLFEQVRAGAAAPSRNPAAGAQSGSPDHSNGSANGSPPDAGLLTRDIRLSRGGQRLTYQAVATRTPGGGTLLVLRDVSALSAAVQMKTDFVANASHELRTPIAAIKIAFETLREVYGDDAQQSERCMQIIDGHLKRLEEMLRDLLDLSKVERENLDLNVRPLKTADVFTHLRSSLGPMALQKGVELRLGAGGDRADGADAGPRPEEFLADEVLLNLVLKNLVENSIKFTPAGGSVRVSFRHGPASGAGKPPVVLAVTDTGIGIPPEHLDRVFERFYQVDPARSGSAGRGTGLGLAIVKHAVAALGGALKIESAVGAGTTVTCTLPQEKQGKPDPSDFPDPPDSPDADAARKQEQAVA